MPAIASVFVEVLPETSKIAPEIRKVFREAGANLPKFQAEADTTKAEEQLQATARKPRKSTVNADADTSKAEEQLDRAARDRKAKITAGIDRSEFDRLDQLMTSGTTKQISAYNELLRAKRAFANQSAGEDPLEYVRGITNIRNATSAFEQAMSDSTSTGIQSGGAAGLSALSPALLGVGVTMAAGIASALSGAVGLIPAGLAGAGSVIGTLAVGLNGVKDAWDSTQKAAQSSGAEQAAKSKEVASAQRSLRDAVQSEEQAQKDVAQARKDALTQLRDLNLEMRGGALDERQAILDAAAARRDLQTGRFKDSIEYQQAQLRVEEADQRVAEAHQRNADLQTKAADAQAKGVDGADNVVRANQNLARTQEQVAVAQQNVTDATNKASSAQTTAAQDWAKLAPNAQAFLTVLQGLKPMWDQLQGTVQNTLFAGVGDQLQQLATQYMPMLQSAMSGMAGTMSQAFGQLAQFLTQPQTMAAMQTIFSNIGQSFQIWSQSIVPFTQAFVTFTQVGSSFLPQLAQMAVNFANAFNQWAQSGQLTQWIQTAMTSLQQLGQIMPSIMQLFLGLAPIGTATLGMIAQILPPLVPSLIQLAGEIGQLIVVATPLIVDLLPLFTSGIQVLTQMLNDNITPLSTVAGWTSTFSDALESLTSQDQGVNNLFTAIEHGLSNILDPLRFVKDTIDALKGLFSGDNATDTANKLRDAAVQAASGGPPIPQSLLNAQVPSPGSGLGGGGGSFNWDAVAQAESSGNWQNRDTGNNGHFGGLQFSPETWLAYGGGQFAQNPADASREEQIEIANRTAFTGFNGKPPQGLGAWETITKGMVPGITTSSTPSGNIGDSLSWSAPRPPVMPSWSGKPPASPVAPAVSVVAPTGIDAQILASVPAGRYTQSERGDLTKGLADCSSAIEDLVNIMQGRPTAGAEMYTGNEADWLTKHGFLPTNTPMPGTFQVGFNTTHTQATLPGGTNFNWGSNASAAQRGIGGTGAWDPAFTQHYYLPGSNAPASGATAPLGTSTDPYYMQYPDGYQPPGPDLGQFGQQMGTDIWDAVLPEGFKNPTQWGSMKFLTGLINGLTGINLSKVMGGDGASQFAPGGGGGGGGGGLGGLLSGLIPQPVGRLKSGSPADAHSQFMPGMPTPGDAAISPFGITGGALTAGPGNQPATTVDNSININNPIGQDHLTNMVNTAQQAQIPRVRQGVRPLPG